MFSTGQLMDIQAPGILSGSLFVYSCGSPPAGVTCGAESLDAEGTNFTATPYCETVITESLFMTNDLAYRSVGSIDQADLEIPDTDSFTAIGSGSGIGSMSFGSGSLLGICTTSELGNMNSIGNDLMPNGRFNIGEVPVCADHAQGFGIIASGPVM